MTTGIDLIAAERRRQIEEEGAVTRQKLSLFLMEAVDNDYGIGYLWVVRERMPRWKT